MEMKHPFVSNVQLESLEALVIFVWIVLRVLMLLRLVQEYAHFVLKDYLVNQAQLVLLLAREAGLGFLDQVHFQWVLMEVCMFLIFPMSHHPDLLLRILKESMLRFLYLEVDQEVFFLMIFGRFP